MSEYTIRWWESGDCEQFLELYRTVLDGDRTRRWFDWKYVDNPYVDHVPIVVAERAGELVGARAFFALPMAVEGQHCTALQPCDTMVDPAHQRRGLFTRMTERAIERYRDGEPAFFFNFPNDNSLPGNRKLGWEPVAQLPIHYRIDDPRGLTAGSTGLLERVAGTLATPVFGAYNRLRDGLASTPGDVTVRRDADLPATTLTSLADGTATRDIHAVRDAQFYEWRFQNPLREYVTYVGVQADPVAAIVVSTPADGDAGVVEISEAVPFGDAAPAAVQAALLERVVADHADANLFAAPSYAIDGATLRRFGFHSGGRFPLSVLGTARTQVARGFDDNEVHGRDVTNPKNWRFTFAEVDSR